MLSKWAWIGPTDVLRADEAVVPGNQRRADARQALSGFLYLDRSRHFEDGFVESVKQRTAADFGIETEGDIPSFAMNLYDVCTNACVHAHAHCG